MHTHTHTVSHSLSSRLTLISLWNTHIHTHTLWSRGNKTLQTLQTPATLSLSVSLYLSLCLSISAGQNRTLHWLCVGVHQSLLQYYLYSRTAVQQCVGDDVNALKEGKEGSTLARLSLGASQSFGFSRLLLFVPLVENTGSGYEFHRELNFANPSLIEEGEGSTGGPLKALTHRTEQRNQSAASVYHSQCFDESLDSDV